MSVILFIILQHINFQLVDINLALPTVEALFRKIDMLLRIRPLPRHISHLCNSYNVSATPCTPYNGRTAVWLPVGSKKVPSLRRRE